MANDKWYDRLVQALIGTPDSGIPEGTFTTPDGRTHQNPTELSLGVATPGLGGGSSLVPFRGGLATGGRQAAGTGVRRWPGRVDVLGTTRNTRQALPSGGRTGARQPVGPGRNVNANTPTNLSASGRRMAARRAAMGVGTAGAVGVGVSNLTSGAGPQPGGTQPGDRDNRSARPSHQPSSRRGRSAPGGMSPNRGGVPSSEVYGQQGPSVAQPQIDPYREFLQSQYDALASSYDAQIDAVGGLAPIYRQQGAESQQNIGNFFGHAGDVANAGIPVTEEIYSDATGNVNQVYDDLGARLEGLPGQLHDIASAAGGSAVDSSVAGRVAAASAPFMAAGETSRANATANLAQHSSAGQNYLNQLASSTGAESAMHQSAIESSLNQQLQLVAARQAELEGAKARGLMEISADIAGASAEQMGNQALAQALGLDHLPGTVDPMQYLRGQSMMQGEQVDPVKQARDLVGLEQAQHNLFESRNPDWERQSITQSMSPPAQQIYSNVLQGVESQFETQAGLRDNPRDMAMMMLQELDRMSEEGDIENSSFVRSGMNNLDPSQIENEIREAIRRLHG